MSDMYTGPEGGIARFDTYHGRTEGGLFHSALRYPSPFFDIGHTYLPTSVRQMFRWCRYYFLTSPLINAVTYKMAQYPITDLIFDEADSELRESWKEISEYQLRLRSFCIEVGLDYFTYGNAFVTIYWPFEKYLTCPNCKNRQKISEADYRFRNMKYEYSCPKCMLTSEAGVEDINIKNLKGIRLMRWNPEYITVEHNEATGDDAYFFEIPQVLRNDILMGKKHIIETVPDVFIKAIRESKSLRFTSESMFHLKRPTIAEKDQGWGIPLILPVLKDTYYLQILRKAQEAIAQQHIVPLRILFPAGREGINPYAMSDLGLWRKRIEAEIQKWRMDPNYIPILPLPIGNQTLGGEGRALMLHQEMRAWSEQIVAGMHVPIEFVFGGLQYSGSNVSMRMLENQFLNYRTELLILVRDFILGRIAAFMEWKKPKCHFKRFKMADDLQRVALLFQMNQAMKMSDTTLLDEVDLDIVQEEKYKFSELNKQLEGQRRTQLAQAALQGEVQVLQTKYQIQAQKMMMNAGVQPQQPGDAGGAAAGGAPPDGGMPEAGGGAPGTQQPMQGEEAAPGMPDGATVYPENAQQTPQQGIPQEMQSPLNMAQQQGGMSVLALARRAATYLQKLDDASRYVELMKMKGMNPQLYTLVNQLLTKEQGSQTDNLNPLQSPLPQQKPPRRQMALV